MQQYVIIGNGIAGISAAETIRSLDPEGNIAIIANEEFPPYSRPMISMVLEGSIGHERLPIRPHNFYEDLRIDALVGDRAVSIDVDQRQVVTDRGRNVRPTIGYSSRAEQIPDQSRLRAWIWSMSATLGPKRTCAFPGSSLAGSQVSSGAGRRPGWVQGRVRDSPSRDQGHHADPFRVSPVHATRPYRRRVGSGRAEGQWTGSQGGSGSYRLRRERPSPKSLFVRWKQRPLRDGGGGQRSRAGIEFCAPRQNQGGFGDCGGSPPPDYCRRSIRSR